MLFSIIGELAHEPRIPQESAVLMSGQISDKAEYRLRDIAPNGLEKDVIERGMKKGINPFPCH